MIVGWASSTDEPSSLGGGWKMDWAVFEFNASSDALSLSPVDDRFLVPD
jgi:hypothetical protein